MLIAEARREASLQCGRHARESVWDDHRATLDSNQVAPEQQWQPARERHPFLLGASPDQPQELGDSARADGGHPVAAYVRIVGLHATVGRFDPHREKWPNAGGRTNRCPRGERSRLLLNGRTSIGVPGGSGRHVSCSTRERKRSSSKTNDYFSRPKSRRSAGGRRQAAGPNRRRRRCRCPGALCRRRLGR